MLSLLDKRVLLRDKSWKSLPHPTYQLELVQTMGEERGTRRFFQASHHIRWLTLALRWIQFPQAFGNCVAYPLSYIVSLNPYKVLYPLLFRREDERAEGQETRPRSHSWCHWVKEPDHLLLRFVLILQGWLLVVLEQITSPCRKITHGVAGRTLQGSSDQTLD